AVDRRKTVGVKLYGVSLSSLTGHAAYIEFGKFLGILQHRTGTVHEQRARVFATRARSRPNFAEQRIAIARDFFVYHPLSAPISPTPSRWVLQTPQGGRDPTCSWPWEFECLHRPA